MPTLDPIAVDHLVARAQAGDEPAFRDLIAQTHRELRCFVAAHATSLDLIEEVVQAAYVTCFQELSRYELRGTFLSWLKGIARNRLRQELAARARFLGGATESLEGLVLAATPPLEEGDDRAALHAGLGTCLDRLAPSARTILDRFYRDGRSLNELAQQFHKKRGAMATMLSRIRGVLRQCLEHQGIAP